MSLSEKSCMHLAGLWGSYDFRIIRDKHFPTAPNLAENFLELHSSLWSKSENPIHQELLKNIDEVKRLVYNWASTKIETIIQQSLTETVQMHIMFKQLHYGDYKTINFGSIGTNWKKKSEIAKELQQYRPWSMDHAANQPRGFLRRLN